MIVNSENGLWIFIPVMTVIESSVTASTMPLVK